MFREILLFSMLFGLTSTCFGGNSHYERVSTDEIDIPNTENTLTENYPFAKNQSNAFLAALHQFGVIELFLQSKKKL